MIVICFPASDGRRREKMFFAMIHAHELMNSFVIAGKDNSSGLKFCQAAEVLQCLRVCQRFSVLHDLAVYDRANGQFNDLAALRSWNFRNRNESLPVRAEASCFAEWSFESDQATRRPDLCHLATKQTARLGTSSSQFCPIAMLSTTSSSFSTCR